MVETFSLPPKPLYWHNYLRTLPKSQLPSHTPEIATDVLDKYLRLIRRDVQIEPEWYGGPKPDLKALGIDLKYDQLKCVAPVCISLNARPLLLDYFKRRNFRILHLVRKNLAHAAISLILANMRNVWHTYNAKEFGGRYKISWVTLYSHMKFMRDERNEFLRLSQDLPMLTCVYEDLINDLSKVNELGEFPKETTVLKPLADFLGISNLFVYDGKMRKVVNKPYADILENFDELMRELRSSEFSEFADSLESFNPPPAVVVQPRAA